MNLPAPLLLLFTFYFHEVFSADLPTLYEYYTGDGIKSGLSADQPDFYLNDKKIVIYSGAMHYFRIPVDYWRDRLRKLRAAGLNTVETYVPWNLHEFQNGEFDFGDGGSDLQRVLSIRYFIELAQEEDLFVILRPGPYICSEWEWGGLPSWLLREKNIKVRTSDEIYMMYVKRYFDVLLPQLVDLQFTKGGPIIAVQVENEYGSSPEKDLDYIEELVEILHDNNIEELLVSSDGASNGQSGTLPGTLFQTVNFGSNPESSFMLLEAMQPGKPIMAMEYWSGRFDHWTENHHTVDNDTFRDLYGRILDYPASVSMYMFHGGTNWGFLNGANIGTGDNSQYQPTTTSYDYDAPLSEAGDYTGKYEIVRELIAKHNPVRTFTPDPPDLIPRVIYSTLPIQSQIPYTALVEEATPVVYNREILSMEELLINDNSGQSYGYLIYRKEEINITSGSILTIEGHLRDSVMVLVNGKLISEPLRSSEDLNGFGYWRQSNSSITLTDQNLTNATLDLVVENWGRANFGNFYYQRKGFTDENRVLINGEEAKGWLHFPLEFKTSWNRQLSRWSSVENGLGAGPGLYRTTLTLHDVPQNDTYIDMRGWTKGVVIVNGFVLGRYALIGPQQTLYLPAPFLGYGDNDIIVFEQFIPGEVIIFSKDPVFETK